MKKLLHALVSLAALPLCAALLALGARAAAPDDFRAVWVSTVYHLDYPAAPTTDAQALMRQADAILDGCRQMGMNAVILQVRPSADALYPSAIFPWSAYLTGECGAAPADGFDPLGYWVEGAHARGMQLHAWINPLRVTKGGQEELEGLPPQSPASRHPQWLVRHSDGNYYLNPGLPAVRALVEDGVRELLAGYEVDGIHLDDYFYPGQEFDDGAAYREYGAGLPLADWRRENINRLIKGLGDLVRAEGGGAVFGVSPAGIWANSTSLPEGSATSGGESYFSHYADSKKWVEEGWVDYICPQIYWYIGHPKADYETLARWWAGVVRGTGVKLYIGMADYQAGNQIAGSPWHGTAAIREQMALNRALPQVAGEVHFRYGLLAANRPLAEYYAAAYRGANAQ